ncbi:MAG: hypothetical protein JWQ81_1682 [Amycolatopsis sp.]|jgi:hypothetical protein|uniref:hypothetical protein n=1 Tax=Amycolatopsis sp. TaxID=37632 RepID=UPI0026018CDB|nr:hypothetical protein [Amycolatopsis sp.]MCU1680943.1 hypothetical protein [Amycolatopsis sp.]
MPEKTDAELAAEATAADAATAAAASAAAAAAQEKIDGEDKLGEPGQRALAAIREERNAAKTKATALETELAGFRKAEQEKADASKSEQQKREEAHTALATRAEKAELELLKLDIGLEHGLTKAQAKRLVGTTKEELDADAADLLETFGGTAAASGPPDRRPIPKLRAGSKPNEEPEETDPAKLAAQIRR